MHVLRGTAERFEDGENEALAAQSNRTWPHMFARFEPSPEAFLSVYASNHIHGVPGDKRAELQSVCALLDVDCIEL
jgi:L-fucose isomerase